MNKIKKLREQKSYARTVGGKVERPTYDCHVVGTGHQQTTNYYALEIGVRFAMHGG